MKLPASWRTSGLGLIAVIAAIINFAGALLDDDPNTVADYDMTAAAVAAGVGLMTARNNKVSSEQAGAKP